MEATRAAVRGMVELLRRRHGTPAVEAYMLCTVCSDLGISEIVQAVVGFWPSFFATSPAKPLPHHVHG
jgi:acetamidase/formamidase